jgi:hypothetical protein
MTCLPPPDVSRRFVAFLGDLPVGSADTPEGAAWLAHLAADAKDRRFWDTDPFTVVDSRDRAVVLAGVE